MMPFSSSSFLNAIIMPPWLSLSLSRCLSSCVSLCMFHMTHTTQRFMRSITSNEKTYWRPIDLMVLLFLFSFHVRRAFILQHNDDDEHWPPCQTICWANVIPESNPCMYYVRTIQMSMAYDILYINKCHKRIQTNS